MDSEKVLYYINKGESNMILKKCKDCGVEAYTEEELDLFSPASTCTYGKKNLCRICSSIRSKEWKNNNKEQAKEVSAKHRALKRYGVTLEEYEECMNTSVVCQICGTTEDLVYDHDHNTPKNKEAFRGVLCRQHNSALGFLNDDSELVLKAYLYLKGEL